MERDKHFLLFLDALIPAILLRESYREGKKTRKRTLANLSKWPVHLVEGLRVLLRGGAAIENLEEAFEVTSSLPHGHVAAGLGSLRRMGVERMIDSKSYWERDLVIAMIISRIIDGLVKSRLWKFKPQYIGLLFHLYYNI